MSDKLRSVNTRFWDDTFISELNPSEKLLFLYLITNPLTNLLGIYEITIKRISFDTGLKTDIIRKGFERFEKVKKVFFVDGFIILPNFLKNQRLNANMKIAVSKEFNGLPNELKSNILGNGSEGLSNDSEGFQMVRERLGKYEIEIESEIEDEKGNENSIDFEIFWNLYDKKVGKKEKIKSKWDKLTKEIQQKILDYLPEYIKSQPNKQFRKHPETFLNNESWNDEIINETSGIDKVELKEYYTKEYRGADDKTIKESYGKFCKCIFDETKAWGDKPFFLAKIDKPLSYHEFKIIHNTLKFSDSTYADWEFIMSKQITEFPQYYKNKKSVNEIFKNAIWGKLKIKVK